MWKRWEDFASDPESADEGFQMGRLNVYRGLNVYGWLFLALEKHSDGQVDIELAMEKARSSRIDLANQVKKSFYSLLLAQDSYEVFKKTYATDSLNLENIATGQTGIVAEYDVLPMWA